MTGAAAMRALIVLFLIGALSGAMAAQPPAIAPLPVPLINQEEDGCGAAAVAMVMHYWESSFPSASLVPVSARDVYRELYDAESGGVRLAAMSSYLADAGFQAFTLRGNEADLVQHLARGRPVIVALSNKGGGGLHFAVLSGLDGRQVWLNDPAKKKIRRLKRGKFEKQWANAGHWMLVAAPAPAGR